MSYHLFTLRELTGEKGRQEVTRPSSDNDPSQEGSVSFTHIPKHCDYPGGKLYPKLSGGPAAAGLGPFFLTCKLTQMGKLQTQQEGLCLRLARCNSRSQNREKGKAQCIHSLPNPFS